MGRFARLAESMAANAELDVTFHSEGTSTADLGAFGTVELTDDVITALDAHTPDQKAITIQPNKQGGGIDNGVDLLRAIHSSKSTHAFEMRSVNERVGFQYVMGSASARNKLVRQLEGFYPDSHIDAGEYENPPLLPLHEGWHMAGAQFRLRRRRDGEHLYPIRHINNEGFENDPYNSITSEMVGERESDDTTNVALQVLFEPAPANWYKPRSFCGKTLEPGIDSLVDDLKHPREGTGPGAALQAYAKHLGPGQTSGSLMEDLQGQHREATDEERLEAKFLLTQRGEKGYQLNVRVFAVGETAATSAQRVQETAAMFEGYYDSTTEQGFNVRPLSDEELLAEAKRAYARERADVKMVMGLTAASGLMHIPDETINTQNVEWSMTSFAGDIPADAERFSDLCASKQRWAREDRSHVMEALSDTPADADGRVPDDDTADAGIVDSSTSNSASESESPAAVWHHDLSPTWDGYRDRESDDANTATTSESGGESDPESDEEDESDTNEEDEESEDDEEGDGNEDEADMLDD